MHESGEFTKLLTYIHSLMTGVCVAFFIGLFSAGPTAISGSTALLISAILFSISLTMNALFSGYFLLFGGDKEITFELYAYSELINHLSMLAILLPFVSFAFMFFYFSKLVGLIFLLSLVFSSLSIVIIIKQIDKNKDILRKMELEINNLHELEEFEKIYEFSVYSDDERKDISLEFGLLLSLKIKLNDFMSKGGFDKEDIESIRIELINFLINICNTRVINSGLNVLIKKTIIYLGDDNLNEIDTRKYINKILSNIDSTRSLKLII